MPPTIRHPKPDLVRRALAEERVLLTRDLDMTRRRVIVSGQLRAILLRHDRVEEQLRQTHGL